MQATRDRLMQMPQINWAMFPRSSQGPLSFVLSTCMATRCLRKLAFKFLRYAVSDDLAVWLSAASCCRHCSIGWKPSLVMPEPGATKTPAGRFSTTVCAATGSNTRHQPRMAYKGLDFRVVLICCHRALISARIFQITGLLLSSVLAPLSVYWARKLYSGDGFEV